VCVSAVGRRLLRAGICGAVAAPRAAEALGEGVRVRGRGARLRRGPVEAGGCACRRSGAVCCAPSFAVRSLLRVRPRRLWGVFASAVALRVLRRGPFASSGQVVMWRRKRRWWRGGCWNPFPVARAVKTLGESGCLGGCAVSSAARTRRGGRSSCLAGADASAGVRRLSPHGRGFTCARGVAGCPARLQSRSVCRRAVSAVCAAEPSGRGGRDGGCVASLAVRSPLSVRSRRWGRVLRRGPFEAGGQVVGLRRTRRWLRNFFWSPFPVPRAAKSSEKGGCVGGRAALAPHGRARRAVQSWGGQTRRRATFVGARSRCRAWSSNWASADAAVVARRHLRCGRRAACGRGVGGGCACRQSGGVCCRAVCVV